jgi:hypothetical protein
VETTSLRRWARIKERRDRMWRLRGTESPFR